MAEGIGPAELVRLYFAASMPHTTRILEFTVTRMSGESFIVQSRVHDDVAANARYVSYLVPEVADPVGIAVSLLDDPRTRITEADKLVQIVVGSSRIVSPLIDTSTLPFSGLVYLYFEGELAPAQRRTINGQAQARGLRAELRDRADTQRLDSSARKVAFVCHDSRDKDEFVRPLVIELHRHLCSVWYDEFSLAVGDSLRESIDQGLSECDKCVVVLSHNFMSNPGWTKVEFNAIVGEHARRGGKVILPIWHGVTEAEVRDYSPLVVDLFALRSSEGVERVAERLLRTIQPPSFFGASPMR